MVKHILSRFLPKFLILEYAEFIAQEFLTTDVGPKMSSELENLQGLLQPGVMLPSAYGSGEL